ncbi:DUF6526 family protein [Chengkuizengella axinellae]|uniref:DUF6526 family protein n=1 Tax=Chengkuizengella axinellae TaxID=3064388 RepID=A0ABT9J2R8_9BACL|nr:DUF6526 family protein [Chengkuizengella sp. 2205SS18-9]MDP5275788.1 DUF6526 family protein [Chengkuizengella sp. 2205SS18-9]
MTEQNYKNHVRMHPVYHYVGAPIVFIAFIGTIIHLVLSIISGENISTSLLWVGGAVGLFIVFGLVRLYSNKLQDRVIRSEENLRHYVLTGRLLDPNLKMSQIIALRFASDEEFPVLCEKAVKENLDSKQIKRSVQNWRGDYVRI